MAVKRLIWVFAALFVIFGLPLAVVEDQGLRRLCGSLSLVGLGGFALCLAGDGLASGAIRWQFSLIERAKQPVAFWAAVAIVTLAGLGVLVAAAWAAFFKAW